MNDHHAKLYAALRGELPFDVLLAEAADEARRAQALDEQRRETTPPADAHAVLAASFGLDVTTVPDANRHARLFAALGR